MSTLTFDIFNKKAILYGAASIGSIVCDLYEKRGLTIDCFLDMRSSEIQSFKGYKVYSLDDEEILGKRTDEYYVIISVKNVFEHTNIANALIEKGFQNLIFMPISAIDGHGTDNQNILYNAYSNIISGNFDKVSNIPKSVKKDMYVPHDESLIAKQDGFVTAYVSIEQLYTDKKKRRTPWFSRPVLCLLPHIDLFRYISGDNRYTCERYLRFCMESAANSDVSITEAWKQNIIKNRSMVYEHMSHSMELDNDFFVRNAPLVNFDKDNGIFNLNSGKHRAAYYASIKRKYIPVKMSINDYAEYINEDKIRNLVKYVDSHEIFELKAPIPHPYFFNYPCETKEFYYGLLYWMMYRIAEKVYTQRGNLDFSDLKILCALDDYGFLERSIIRAGASVTIIKNNNTELEMVINEALSVKKGQAIYDDLDFCSLVREKSAVNAYDLVLVDSRAFPEKIKALKTDNLSVPIIEISDERKADGVCVFESVASGKFVMVYEW